ncbi:sugar nucleotide-binding protein [Ruminococcaceae bacterium OttesenSCG-928-I18]|nr:sugar nucleotide-binding protein [Ruminococcaceae bacterium OttesenSCG-928-I18]
MKHTLVGHTGFVGGNLAAGHTFDAMYHSTDIEESFGADNGLVIYSGMPSEKFLANADPAADLAVAEKAMDNIRKMRPEQLVLISTVDVYPRPFGVYEDTAVHSEEMPAYGKNRRALEDWVRQAFPEALIVRLPGLFGKGLKKNFIYDMLTIIPMMLREDRFEQLSKKNPLVRACYAKDEAGFYRLEAEQTQREELKAFFENNDFNALSFTDSRSVFQFYNLANLWTDLSRCLKMNLRLMNLATEPVEAGALYKALFGEEFVNYLDRPPAFYDVRTHYGREFGGDDDYVADRDEVLAGIGKFVRTMIS